MRGPVRICPSQLQNLEVLELHTCFAGAARLLEAAAALTTLTHLSLDNCGVYQEVGVMLLLLVGLWVQEKLGSCMPSR